MLKTSVDDTRQIPDLMRDTCNTREGDVFEWLSLMFFLGQAREGNITLIYVLRRVKPLVSRYGPYKYGYAMGCSLEPLRRVAAMDVIGSTRRVSLSEHGMKPQNAGRTVQHCV